MLIANCIDNSSWLTVRLVFVVTRTKPVAAKRSIIGDGMSGHTLGQTSITFDEQNKLAHRLVFRFYYQQ